jgi:DNA-directed RNA polymerase II subunit RPB4
VFARFKDEENIKAVERLLNSHTELEMFERSQLGEFPFPRIDPWIGLDELAKPRGMILMLMFGTGSLCCDNAEEAKSLIPSLQNKISDGELQELLDELTKLRNFTE